MPRQKIGNKQTLGISLNDGLDEDAAILGAIRASGQSPSQAIRAALIVWMSAANAGLLDAEDAPTSASVDLGWLKEDVDTLRRELAKLNERFASNQAVADEALSILRVLRATGATNAVVVSRDEDGNNLVELPLSPGFIESVKLAAKGRPAMRLDDNGDIVQ